MKYLDAIKISLFAIARILFAVAVVLLLAYIVYRCLPRRIKCKITRWLKTLGSEDMKILVACEESQAVTKELRRLGHEAYSCDIIDQSGGHPEWHIRWDALALINGSCSFMTTDGEMHRIDGQWDMLIAHPPCTYLSNAGARFLYPKGVLNEERLKKGLEAKEFFMHFYNADCEKIAIENPIPTKIYGLPPYSQTIQPWQFGHPLQKKTCFWLKGLPALQPTNIVEERQSTKIAGNWFNHGGKDRQKNRAKTFPGIAKAMAEQWAGKNGK